MSDELDIIDEAGRESFPASDAPGWIGRDPNEQRRKERPRALGGLHHVSLMVQEFDPRDLGHHGVAPLAEPRTHRDGARSFMCLDPDGTKVQLLYHPQMSRAGSSGSRV